MFIEVVWPKEYMKMQMLDGIFPEHTVTTLPFFVPIFVKTTCFVRVQKALWNLFIKGDFVLHFSFLLIDFWVN